MSPIIFDCGRGSIDQARAMKHVDLVISSSLVYGPITYAPAREDLPGLPWQKMHEKGLQHALIESILSRFAPIVVRIGMVLEDLRVPNILDLGDEGLLKFTVISQDEADLGVNLALKHGKRGEIYNLGRKTPISVLDLVNSGCPEGPWIGPFPVLDCSKARRELGWEK